MLRSKGNYQLPFNTPFEEIEKVVKFCRNEAKGVSKAALRRLLRVSERTFQYKKYAFFWTGWIAEEESRFILTDSGCRYLDGDEKEKRQQIWRQIKRYPPYHRPLKLAYLEGRNSITQDWVQKLWRSEFAKAIAWDVNPQRFDRAPKFFIEICKVSALGSTIAVDGALALELDQARLKDYVQLSQNVFIGHGHNRIVLRKVRNFIETSLSLNGLIAQTLPDRFSHIDLPPVFGPVIM